MTSEQDLPIHKRSTPSLVSSLRDDISCDAGDGFAGTIEDLKGRDDLDALVKRPMETFAVRDNVEGQRLPSICSGSTLGRAALDLLTILPAACYLAFGLMVYLHEGTEMDAPPIAALQSFARSGAVVFPIVFAAVVGRSLTALATWRLERGITILNLEFLLGSRTVLSTFWTPLALRTANLLTPFLLALWALSPLGGEAVSHIMTEASSILSAPTNVSYLAYNPEMATGLYGATGAELLPATNAAFQAALVSPALSKSATEDIFGNIKVPMVQTYLSSNISADSNGWYIVDPAATIYSSILGLPVVEADASPNAVYDFEIGTSYMYANCSVFQINPGELSNPDQYTGLIAELSEGAGGAAAMNTTINSTAYWYSNGRSFLIETDGTHNVSSEYPLLLNYTSVANGVVTNAICSVTTTFVDIGVRCLESICIVSGIRFSTKQLSGVPATVLDDTGPAAFSNADDATFTLSRFLETFVNASAGPWANMWTDGAVIASPIEVYLSDPDSPYTPTAIVKKSPLEGSPYTASDRVFSQRFTQLLNSYWIASINPLAVTGAFEMPDATAGSTVQNVTGTATFVYNVMECNKAWLAVLLLACLVMIVAAIIAAILRILQRGPDVLDRPVSLLRNSPYAQIGHVSSTQSSRIMAKQYRDLEVRLGDVRPDQEVGYIAVGTPGDQIPVQRLRVGRLYG